MRRSTTRITCARIPAGIRVTSCETRLWELRPQTTAGFATAERRRISDIFATGVDIHGVHDWTSERAASLLAPRYEKPADISRALDIAWKSSPVSSVSTWRSPVLLIHADDDRNVRFNQTVSLARRLEKQGVTVEEIVIPDDTHHMMRHMNWVLVDSATASWWFGRTVSAKP